MIQEIQSKGNVDREALRIAYDTIDNCIKKIIDLFKKKNAPFAPTRSVLAIITTLATRWEPLKKYIFYLTACFLIIVIIYTLDSE